MNWLEELLAQRLPTDATYTYVHTVLVEVYLFSSNAHVNTQTNTRYEFTQVRRSSLGRILSATCVAER